MKNLMRKLVSLLLIFSMGVPAFAVENKDLSDVPYDYGIEVGSDEWNDLSIEFIN